MGYRITVTIDVGELLLMLGITDNSPTSLWFWMRTEAARGRLGGFDHVFFFFDGRSTHWLADDLPMIYLCFTWWFDGTFPWNKLPGRLQGTTISSFLVKIHHFSDCNSIVFWWLPTAINWVVKSQQPKMQRRFPAFRQADVGLLRACINQSVNRLVFKMVFNDH